MDKVAFENQFNLDYAIGIPTVLLKGLPIFLGNRCNPKKIRRFGYSELLT